MNALSQYLDLYEAHAPEIDAGSTRIMNAARTTAAGFLRDTRLPRRGDKGYVYSSPDEMFAPDLGVNIRRVPFVGDAAAALRSDVPVVSAAPLVVTNDHIDLRQPIFGRLPEGLTICPMRLADQVLPGVMERYYGHIAGDSDATTALNTLLAQDGVLVHVARGARIARPVQILNLLSATQPVLALRRMLIVLEQDSQLSLVVCDHTHHECAPSTVSAVIETDLAPGAHLDYCDLEESQKGCSRCMSFDARVDAAASLHVVASTLCCGHTRNNYRVELNGEGAELRMASLGIVGDGEICDASATVLHNAPHCQSDQLFKYVACDGARAAFEGLIRVAHGAHHTEAYQANRNVVTSENARVHTAPQLEIYCDDVRCSHGAATGRLDQQALFYMRTRGIPEQEARSMLMQAFMADVLNKIHIEPLRTGLNRLVAERLTAPV